MENVWFVFLDMHVLHCSGIVNLHTGATGYARHFARFEAHPGLARWKACEVGSVV
jgi:hypothetical protein